ncbi:TPA: ImmA/IrrE family metallo-endopeptidase [Streptococcus suis]|nr:ImmA/IrrE family metallo-endopeptidase [Streptococcus suis]HEM5553923.1 ImmA/IrrE family metallo-endopeptidase [Streptococcus suis]HEM6287237.1 ImmA/IrrE family metallo-endopeptidase [Streptococcus suis]HEM6293623.1 ImmA/IrrE family metallo-endopeptidase [Streptococcus suis]HEM6400416.1 ImmA/IrrE family metallo-endopeptidase [Streptococcus suis]
MVKFKRPTREIYMQYHANAYRMLLDIAEYFEIYVSQINFHHVIDFFETNFKIMFVYFESDLMYKWFPSKKPEIKYNLTRQNELKLVDNTFCSVCSGMTIPDAETGKYVVYINQDVNKSRVMFTILHELTHIYCHLMDSVYEKVLVSKTTSTYSDSYPPEIAPLEDEANAIASILFLNDDRLLKYIKSGIAFEELKEKTQMSQTALHNRLMNFLMYNCNCQEYYALSIVMGYRNDEDWAIITLQQFEREFRFAA